MFVHLIISVVIMAYATESQSCLEKEDIALINGIRSSLNTLENKVGAKLLSSSRSRLGWIEYKDHWYYISSERKTWDQAEIYCRQQGGYLVAITDSAENDWVIEKVKDTFKGQVAHVWIGASSFGGKIWKWVNTWSPLSYTSWGSGQPANGLEECAALGGHENYKWHDFPCNEHKDMSFLCERQQMVLPTVLKIKHSLRETNILPVVKRIRFGKPDSLKEFSRISKDSKTEELDFEEIDGQVKNLTGESVGEILMMAGRDDRSVEKARWALHCVILYSNEFGQPKSQALKSSTESAGVSASGHGNSNSHGASGRSSGDTGCSSRDTGSSSRDTGSSSRDTGSSTCSSKRKRSDGDEESLKDRITSLENATKIEVFKELKEK